MTSTPTSAHTEPLPSGEVYSCRGAAVLDRERGSGERENTHCLAPPYNAARPPFAPIRRRIQDRCPTTVKAEHSFPRLPDQTKQQVDIDRLVCCAIIVLKTHPLRPEPS